MKRHVSLGLLLTAWNMATVSIAAEQSAPLSHRPLRNPPAVSQRALPTGPAFYVDAAKGDDRGAGTKDAPWRTVRHAIDRLKPGDTLLLRGGTYYENVYLALQGRADAKITIRSYPGEQAIIDGAFSEFSNKPSTAWEPVPGSAIGEYRSTKRYPNLREVLGSFGDSMLGLQTYYHEKDFRATGELVDWENWDDQKKYDIKPLYCGPGLWYDRATGLIHIRLTHTHLPESIDNYKGEQDPRRLPMVIASFASVPLHLDGVDHLRLQDLVIRGAGYTAVVLDHATHVDFENVTVWCGTYGIRANRVNHFRFDHSGLYGNVAPWTFRSDGSKRDYPDRPHRNISRLNTHALLELDSGRESSVYAFPQNDNWEFSYCEFTDAHDGLYFGAVNTRFHHNLIENLQDDGIYLSPMYLRHRLDKSDPEIHIYQNVFRRLLTCLAYGGTEAVAPDHVFVYRNLFDLRAPVNTGRPSTKNAEPSFSSGHLIGDHGSPPWSAMNIYQNTIVQADQNRDASMSSMGGARTGNPRRVFNNIFFHIKKLPSFLPPLAAHDSVGDGNLYWSPSADEKQAAALFKKYRDSAEFKASQAIYEPGSTTNSIVGDPKFTSFSTEPFAKNDYRPAEGSAALKAGIKIPADWPDPLRNADGKPDIGAFPKDVASWTVGR